tara:strand:- start:812 stop:2992 length:2181 start_codon:yes stop_codon:yes gene_type:complete
MSTNQLTLTEYINRNEAHFVLSLSYENFFNTFPKEKTDDISKAKEYFKMIRRYLLSHVSNKFEGVKINYKFAFKQTKGRLYAMHSSGVCLQRIHKSLRSFLTKNIYRDYDIKNAHPTILLALCKKHNIHCPMHEYYVHNRDDVLKDNGVTKSDMLSKLNVDNPHHPISKSKYIHNLCKEWIDIKKQLYDIYYDDFKVDTTTPSKNPRSSIINRLFCDTERLLFNSATQGIEYDVYMFDGFLSRQECVLTDNDLYGVKICWEEKPIESEIEVPNDYEVPENDGDTYSIMKKEFEKDHSKITSMAGFCMINEDGSINHYSRDQFKIMYEDKYFFKNDPETGIQKKSCFMDYWFKDEYKSSYLKLGCYPDNAKCPSDELNTWTPYKVEKMVLEHYDEEVVKLFKEHIEIICNHEEKITEFILKWFAHLFQYPDCKSIMPTFVGGEGCGKSIIFDGLTAMMGQEKVLSSTNSLRDVFGEFNGELAGRKLVILNELKPFDLAKVEGQFKGLITDPMLQINPKGKTRYTIQSYHCFVSCLNPNNEGDGVKSKSGDRRNLVIRCSDEKKSDDDYFNKLVQMFDNENSLATLYKFFIDMPDVPRRITEKMIPISQYQENIKEANRSYIDLWLEWLCIENDKFDEKILLSNEATRSYLDWTKVCNIKEQHEMNSVKMGLRLSNVKECKKVIVKKGSQWTIDLSTLRKRFNLGCLIELDDDGNESDKSFESDLSQT